MLGETKVNMDCFFEGGIGGIFMNSKGKVVLQFGKEVYVEFAVHVEILVLRERLLVAAALRWFLFHFFVFEFDSKFVVVWVIDPLSVLWSS